MGTITPEQQAKLDKINADRAKAVKLGQQANVITPPKITKITKSIYPPSGPQLNEIWIDIS